MNEREVILEAIQSFAIAYNAGDLTAVLASYDDDLVKMRHGAEPESKAETARRVQDVFARFETKVEVSNVELEVNGDMAFTRGTFVVTLAPRGGGETQQVARRYLEIWRKREGRWRVARTMDDVGAV
ncbi:MAG TPA: DUF4440 domain-containing protein [Vicinamibacterales bacterium]|nr:DUF4440 domain-containing protein [Vicinamibacterales bacterium]